MIETRLRVAMICTGNICRSPMGEVVLQPLRRRRLVAPRSRRGHERRHGQLARRHVRWTDGRAARSTGSASTVPGRSAAYADAPTSTTRTW